MSQGEPVPHAEAYAAAERLVAALAPACVRIEIAGSLRRQKPLVRDIELVAVPLWEDRSVGDLWATAKAVDLLEEKVSLMLLGGRDLEARLVDNHRADGRVDRQRKLGPAFKALVFQDIPVDLFIVRPPATWGVIFALRTGPGDWNTRLVTDAGSIGRRVAGGQVQRWAGHDWETVPTPEERDFFGAIGQAWLEPRERRVERVRISRGVAAGVRPA